MYILHHQKKGKMTDPKFDFPQKKHMHFACFGLFVYHWETQRFQLLSQHVKQLHISEVTFEIQTKHVEFSVLQLVP